jgi:hypothetical protein
MRVGKSVQKAIDEWSAGDLESAVLHACNAVDGTGKKVYSELGSTARFTRLLRDNYDIFGPMGAPGVDLVATRFPVSVRTAKAPGGKPDIADVIYGIHRCSHGHGEELPSGFEIFPDAAGPCGITRMSFERGKARLSDRIIFGLLAVTVLSPVNKHERVTDGYYFTFGRSATLMINEWWGRAADFPAVAALEPVPLVKLNFDNWMQ